MPIGKIRYLVNTVSTSWNETPRARHQVAESLSKVAKVGFVARNEIGKARLEVSEVRDNLTVITPYYPLDYRVRYRAPFLNELYQHWLFKRLIMIGIDQTQTRVINFDFTATQIFKYFSDIIYYCNDDPLTQFSKDRLLLPYFYLCEKLVMRNSRFVVVVSDYLMESKKSSKTHLIYLGAEEHFFTSNHSKNSQNKAVLNFMGYINDRLETDWLKQLAVDFPEWRIDLVGPFTEESYGKLSGLNNIVFQGIKRGKELAESLSECSVAIIPFKDNKRMRTCSANNKYWQYLALGKPVVYRNLPYLLNVPEYLMYKANSYAEFKELILKAIKSDNDDLRRRRISFAKENTWDKRIDHLLSLYN